MHSRTRPEIFGAEFLTLRAKVLEVAAGLDRLDRAVGSIEDDPRFAQLQAAIGVLAETDPGRAERVQMAFSREYDPAWRENFGLSAGNPE